MNRASFWLVWGVGVVPVLVASLMYFFGILLPEERKHGGELLNGHHLSQWSLQPKNESLKNDWKLLLTVPGICDTECEEVWNNLGQLHKALGKDKQRVSLIRVGNEAESFMSAGLSKLEAAVWIADPLGNIVLRYSISDPPKQMLRDLRKLLKVSRIG